MGSLCRGVVGSIGGGGDMGKREFDTLSGGAGGTGSPRSIANLTS